MSPKALTLYRLLFVFSVGVLGGCSSVNTPTAPPRPDSPGVALLKADIAAGVTSGPPTFSPSEFAVKAKAVESPNEQVVRERAQKRWNLLVKSDIDTAYEFLSPNARLTLPKNEYKGRIRPGFWTSAQVIRVECEQENRCLVHAQVRVKMVAPQGGLINHDSAVREDWLSVSGQWWFVPVAQ